MKADSICFRHTRSRNVYNFHYILQDCLSKGYCSTVEPVYNGPVLSGLPLLSGHFLKSRFFAHTNVVFVTCIRRPPLLSSRGHAVAVPCLSFFVNFTCFKRPPLNGKAIYTVPWITGIVAGSADSQRFALQTKVSNSEVPNARVTLV